VLLGAAGGMALALDLDLSSDVASGSKELSMLPQERMEALVLPAKSAEAL